MIYDIMAEANSHKMVILIVLFLIFVFIILYLSGLSKKNSHKKDMDNILFLNRTKVGLPRDKSKWLDVNKMKTWP